MITHKIKLYGYTAELVGESQLVLGTVDSYGIERIELEISGIWSGLVLFATFHYSGTPTKMAVDSNGIVEVPPQATQSGSSVSTRGKIVFHAVSETQQAISTDIEYRVYQHSDVDGNEPLPPDTSWNQILAQAGAARDEAVQAASDAKTSLEEIGDSVERAEAAANRAEEAVDGISGSVAAELKKIEQAGTEEVNRVKSEGDAQVQRVTDAGNAASEYAEQAKKSAEEAAGYVTVVTNAANQAVSDVNASGLEQVSRVQSAGNAAVESVESVGDGALQDISTARDSGVQAVNTAQTEGVQAVQTANDDAVQAVEQKQTESVQAVEDAKTTGVQAVQTAQTTAVNAVNDAGNAKIEQIEQINALVPTPTPEDAGKAVVVKPDGTGYELGDVQTDSYTKAESDARYAPIASALKVKCNGTGIGTLTPTVAWWLQSLLIGGRTTQDSTPTPENPVPLVNAGQDGTLDVTVCGLNLFDTVKYVQLNSDFYEIGENGGIVQIKGDGRTISTIPAMLTLPAGQYSVVSSESTAIQLASNGVEFIRASNGSPKTFSLSESTDVAVKVYSTSGVYPSAEYFPVINYGTTIYAYEPYKAQSLPIPTPNGLPGIPLTTGGNCTDENGQQWVCDTIDFEQGVYIQRTQTTFIESLAFSVLSNDANRYYANYTLQNDIVENAKCICSCASWSSNAVDDKTITPYNKYLYFRSNDSDAEQVNALFANAFPLTLMTQLATPITAPLDAETLAAYAALQSYDGTTNIVAPDAMVQASAVADATAIIQQMQEQILALQSAAIGG